MTCVGIVIVSHSPLIAEGTALMAKELAGMNVPVAWCGGNINGGLGSNSDMIYRSILEAWSDAGVAIFVDLGSTEMNSQIAIEKFAKAKQSKLSIMNAPLVEGVIIASSRASRGDSLSEIRKICETI
ncbi:PTS-dependent dihydroxyacetone kinase phosphotransferase subunit DhaM [Alteromonas sp. ZYF713]|nr:PTS-dependent dihydroxyacetone kinase phosphotransferase subunit DhaM [Alteromonas sp. ZYF713]